MTSSALLPFSTSAPPMVDPQVLGANAATLERELAWAEQIIEISIMLYFEQACSYTDIHQITPPDISDDPSIYANTLREHVMSFEQRLILILALIPSLRPQALDAFLMKNTNYDRPFTEFGGVGHGSGNHSGFLPTIETAAFVLTGSNLERRLSLVELFEPHHMLRRERFIDIDTAPLAGSLAGLFNQPLIVSDERLAKLTTNTDYRPDFSAHFPAKRLSTQLEWDDLVLADGIYDDVEEIKAWIEHGETLMRDWQLERHVKPGFRSLFYGPPGTGKTLTACLLGKSCGLDVYRVDLSLVVSKYIGETEKNLAKIFDQAANRQWILFFDEADALFGKRTQTSSSNDRYANQEVSFLLQRVEDFPGVVILATNFKNNIDEAFARRFQSMVYFAMPGPQERLALWTKAFAQGGRLADSVDLEQIAEEFELSGGAIINVLRYASLMTLRRGADNVSAADIRHGIRRELRKEGKVI